MDNVLGKFERREEIGRGAYGVVYKTLDKATKKLFALKMVRFVDEDEGVPATVLREVSTLFALDHHSILRLHDVVYDKHNRIYLVLEYMDQDMRKFMKDCPGFAKNRTLIKSFLRQILHGIEYFHCRRFLHRDLKPQNLLIDRDTKTLKIADFGLSRAFGPFVHKLTHEVVTLWYRTPEILLGEENYSRAVDIWSVGCIFAEMVNQRVLFEGKSEISQLFEIFSLLGRPNEQRWPGVSRLPESKPATFPRMQAEDMTTIVHDLEPAGLDLLSKMLRYEPSKRITAKQALEHEYFKGL